MDVPTLNMCLRPIHHTQAGFVPTEAEWRLLSVHASTFKPPRLGYYRMLLFYQILSTYLTCCCYFAGLTSPDYFGAESWSSENASQPASLTDSMAMVNRILIDEKMDRLGNTDIY